MSEFLVTRMNTAPTPEAICDQPKDIGSTKRKRMTGPKVLEPVVIKNQKQREKWLAKRNQLFWKNESFLGYKPKDRMWCVLTLTRNIAMLDPQLIIDEDGDEVYRMVFKVLDDGNIATDWGFARTFDRYYPKKQYVHRLSPQQELKLDKWFKSMKEDVQRERPDGWRYTTVEHTPLDVESYLQDIPQQFPL